MKSFWSITLATLTKDIGWSGAPRSAQCHAVFLFAGGGDLRFFFRFRWQRSRHIVGGLVWWRFCLRRWLRLTRPWARELRNQVSTPTAFLQPRRMHCFWRRCWATSLCQPAGSSDDAVFIIFYNLRALGPAWQLIPIGCWEPGVGGEWDIFSQPCRCAAQPAN